jgi:hypothetical protein
VQWLWTIVGVLAAAAVAVVIAALVLFNLKRRYIARCAVAATREQLDHIYALVEQTGKLASTGYILGRTNDTTIDLRCLIPIPDDVPDFTWAGRTLEVTASAEPHTRFVDSRPTQPFLNGRAYRLVKVPRQPAKHGSKQRNAFSPAHYVRESAQLAQALRFLCPQYPVELLAYLLCPGRESFEFDPIDQIRIGTSAAWVQTPPEQVCDECHQRMRFVLQLPGSLVGSKASSEATYYFFACNKHPESTKYVCQFT